MNSKKPRKSLDSALANEFVYGSQVEPTKPQPSLLPQDELPIEQELPANKELPKSDLMSQLQINTTKEPTVRLTVDLTESMHRKLSILAAKTGRKKAEIIRILLDNAFDNVNK